MTSCPDDRISVTRAVNGKPASWETNYVKNAIHTNDVRAKRKKKKAGARAPAFNCKLPLTAS
jgi:hypothetical protein